jgi:nucleoside-diphosphate-sugar epimerase
VKSGPVVAVTGANGYVGSVISSALRDETEVLGLVRFPKREDQIAWSFDADPMRTAEELRRRGATHLIHSAWDMKASSLKEVVQSCVRGSQNLFTAARSAGIRNVTFISSISAFDGARSTYGRSKLEVEAMALQAGGIVLRLGLVYGDTGGGLFGNLRRVVRTSRVIPMIGSGKGPQYLLHERVLGHVVRRTVRGDFARQRRPITIATPEPVRIKDILLRIAAEEGRSVFLIPVPWPVLYAGLWSAEHLGLRLNFRSDSVLSFIFQDPSPDFSHMRSHAIDPASFQT